MFDLVIYKIGWEIWFHFESHKLVNFDFDFRILLDLDYPNNSFSFPDFFILVLLDYDCSFALEHLTVEIHFQLLCKIHGVFYQTVNLAGPKLLHFTTVQNRCVFHITFTLLLQIYFKSVLLLILDLQTS
jgi:hypothetical protein